MSNLAKETTFHADSGLSPKEEYEVIVDCLGENSKELESVSDIEERYWRIVRGEEHCTIDNIIFKQI